MEDIPAKLLINLEQSSLKYVPTSNWTFEEKDIKMIEIADLDDKRAKTILLLCSMNGKLFPTQAICTGKTNACLPKVPYPEGWYLYMLCGKPLV